MAKNSHSAARVVTAVVFALLLGACGSSSDTNTPAASPAASTPAAAGGGTTVAVVEKEFSITPSQTTFAPGTYTFTVQNQGSFPHNLIVEGPGVDKKKSALMKGGESSSVTVDLQAGTYELWCGVPTHKDKGMTMKITVA